MEAGEDLIQMEDIAVFDGVEFFFRKFFQIMYMEVAVKPDYRKKDNRNSALNPPAIATIAQKSVIMLIPCLKKPRYISPAPGIREQIKSKNPRFCFGMLVTSVCDCIRKIINILSKLLRTAA